MSDYAIRRARIRAQAASSATGTLREMLHVVMANKDAESTKKIDEIQEEMRKRAEDQNNQQMEQQQLLIESLSKELVRVKETQVHPLPV